MQPATGRVALLIDRLPVGTQLDPAANPQLFACLFGHVVGRMVGHKQFVGHRLDILGEGRPRFLEAGFVGFTVIESLLVGGVLRPTVVLPAADAGDRDGVDAVVDVIHALLAGVFLLQAPHLRNAAVVEPLTV